MKKVFTSVSVSCALAPASALASDAGFVGETASAGALSALWILANMSYAGMRAQGSSSHGWRVTAFVLGFPGTVVSFLAVPERGERAYGIDLPRNPRRLD